MDTVSEEVVPVVAPEQGIRGSRKLEDLLASIPGNYSAAEVDWGKPVGREVW